MPDAPIVAFSPTMQRELDRLCRPFSATEVYRHPRIAASCGMRASVVVATCSTRYIDDPRGAAARMARAGAAARHAEPMRAMSADFIAGMTDRYALAEHRRLFDATPDLR